MEFSKEEIDILNIGLGMYRKKMSKLLKDSVALKAGEKEMKKTFLMAEKLADRLLQEK